MLLTKTENGYVGTGMLKYRQMPLNGKQVSRNTKGSR